MTDAHPLSFFATGERLHDGRLFPELELFEPALADATFDHVDVPDIERLLLPTLGSRRLVVLGGRQIAEKLLFAKHLAWHLSQRLAEQGELCEVRQWHPRSTFVDVAAALTARRESTTIFLLPGLEPHHLGGYDLRRFLDDLSRSQHFAIVTTESEPQRWGPTGGPTEAGIWFDAASLAFTDDSLTNALLTCLKQVADQLPEDLKTRSGPLDESSILAGEHSVRSVAAELRTPTQIRSFALALTRLEELSAATIEATVRQLLDERHAVHLWFRQLSAREQLLSLGLALFDGLLDDQVFAALEILVHHAWREWDPTLAHFDYHELDRVAAYIERGQDLERTAPLACVSESCRRAVLEEGWRLHRRRILATLPTLADLIRDAPGGTQLSLDGRVASTTDRVESPGAGDEPAARAPSDEPVPSWSDEQTRASRWYRHGRSRDLFGSSLRSGLVRHAVAGTLSHVGRLSRGAVEAVLLDLAQDERQSVQAVAAEALARWRNLDAGEIGDRRLYGLLNAWQSDAFQKEDAQRRRHRHLAARPFAYVRATIALTLSRASLYDPPNRLAEPLVHLFEKLATERSRIVVTRFATETVPQLVAGHLQQLSGLLWDNVVLQRDFVVGLAVGIAMAHRLRPIEARSLLEDWQRRARALPTDDAEEEATRRVHVLATVALAYGLLEPGVGPGAFSTSEIFDLLSGLLAGEHEGLIRTAVLAATLRQANTDFRRIAPQVQELLAELALEERAYVVGGLTELYLEQRQRLARSAPSSAAKPDAEEVVDGVLYPLWMASERPSTEVEEILRDWLTDGDHEAAVQVALACVESLAGTALELRESELVKEAAEGAGTAVSSAAGKVKPPAPVRSFTLTPGGYVVLGLLLAIPPWSFHRCRILRAALGQHLHRLANGPTPRRDAMREIWNDGTPRWKLLRERRVLQALLGLEAPEDPVPKRLPSLAPDLAADLGWATRLYALRWVLGIGAVVMTAGALPWLLG